VIGSRVSDFRKNFDLLAKSSDSRIFNGDLGNLKNLDANDFVIFNLFTLEDPSYLDNLRLTKYLREKYSNVSFYNIIVTNEAAATPGETTENTGERLEKFLSKYNVDDVTIQVTRSALEKFLNIPLETNKIIVSDRRYVVRGIFEADTETHLLEKFLSTLGETRITYDRTRVAAVKKSFGGTDEYLIGSMDRVVLVEGLDGLPSPILAVLEIYARRVLLMKFDGEILYIIESKNFCFPGSIKYSHGKLHLFDSCDGSSGYLDIARRKFTFSEGNDKLRDTSDVEPLEDGRLLVSRTIGKRTSTIEFFEKNSSTSRSNRLEIPGRVSNIKKFNGNYYYLDESNNILYSVEIIALDNVNLISPNRVTGLEEGIKISNFYVSRENDAYFLDSINHKILRCYNDKCSEQTQQLDPDQPNDLILYKNLIFVLFDKHLQLFDTYSNSSSAIIPYVSENTRYLSDTFDSIDIANIDGALSPDLFDTIYFMGLDRTELLNPSFLMFLGHQNGKLSSEKLVSCEAIRDSRDTYPIDNGGSIVFGKLFYGSPGKVKIRTVIGKIVGKPNGNN
jgi:hypothetical protein